MSFSAHTPDQLYPDTDYSSRTQLYPYTEASSHHGQLAEDLHHELPPEFNTRSPDAPPRPPTPPQPQPPLRRSNSTPSLVGCRRWMFLKPRPSAFKWLERIYPSNDNLDCVRSEIVRQHPYFARFPDIPRRLIADFLAWFLGCSDAFLFHFCFCFSSLIRGIHPVVVVVVGSLSAGALGVVGRRNRRR